jgi:nucleotidyltransferase substrate binding protein (TIGR01987 family)
MSDTVPQIRWKQRLENFKKALVNLEDAVALSETRALSRLEKQGELKAFEYTFELSWNVMKDYLTFQGISGIIGSRGSFRTAFQNGLISDGETWMEMIEDRNLISHDYDEKTADSVVSRIAGYAALFRSFADSAVLSVDVP